MKAIVKRQKTGWYVTDGRTGSFYSDDTGHCWFTKTLARQLAAESGGWYEQGNRTSIKEVVTAYLPDTLAEIRERMAAAGVTADSPATLDGDGERLAREDRWS